ncbi:hypothetical protein [Propionivibrio sp.]|uniref:hypothetical protein n=1 Tax=Propionivibrio sp. TaxID=2212460 RepID=UPI0025CBEC2A|nr:hypothetical protein [Propionivibrio sp.]MBK8745233.1 hypothetical protein [Propionivibrio sp.]
MPDNPTLAAIEQRISTTREQLRNMERTYTPDFMAMDPTARTLRASLTELERQLTSTRLSSQQAAMADAEEQASGARATVERLRGQIANKRHEALPGASRRPRPRGKARPRGGGGGPGGGRQEKKSPLRGAGAA